MKRHNEFDNAYLVLEIAVDKNNPELGGTSIYPELVDNVTALWKSNNSVEEYQEWLGEFMEQHLAHDWEIDAPKSFDEIRLTEEWNELMKIKDEHGYSAKAFRVTPHFENNLKRVGDIITRFPTLEERKKELGIETNKIFVDKTLLTNNQKTK